MRIPLKTLVILSALALPSLASAVGLSVTPDRLDIVAHPGSATRVELTVTNPSPRVAFFESYPDDMESIIKVAPESWTLESGASRKIVVVVSPNDVGRYRTTLSIVARPIEDAGVAPGSGVKIPVSIVAEEKKSGPMPTTNPRTILLGILIVSLVGAGYLLVTKK